MCKFPLIGKMVLMYAMVFASGVACFSRKQAKAKPLRIIVSEDSQILEDAEMTDLLLSEEGSVIVMKVEKSDSAAGEMTKEIKVIKVLDPDGTLPEFDSSTTVTRIKVEVVSSDGDTSKITKTVKLVKIMDISGDVSIQADKILLTDTLDIDEILQKELDDIEGQVIVHDTVNTDEGVRIIKVIKSKDQAELDLELDLELDVKEIPDEKVKDSSPTNNEQ